VPYSSAASSSDCERLFQFGRAHFLSRVGDGSETPKIDVDICTAGAQARQEQGDQEPPRCLPAIVGPLCWLLIPSSVLIVIRAAIERPLKTVRR
jgi:hypothetical protein